jgi:hypothetical protein
METRNGIRTAILVSLVVLLATACADRRRARRMTDLATPLLAELGSTPGKLPDEPAAGSRLVATLATIREDGKFRFEGSVHELSGGSLRYDRARAGRLTTSTEFWAVVFDEPVDHLLYWVPVSDPRRIRVEPGGVVTLRSGSVALRLPFRPSGWVALFETGATRAEPLDQLQLPSDLDSGLGP